MANRYRTSSSPIAWFRDGYAELCADNNWVPHSTMLLRATRRLLDIQKRYSPGYKCSETGRHLGRDIEISHPCSEALKARPRACSRNQTDGTVVALTRKGGLVARGCVIQKR